MAEAAAPDDGPPPGESSAGEASADEPPAGEPSAGETADRIATRLEEIVRPNRFTIAVVFPVVGATMLVASAESVVGPPLAFNPWLILGGTLVMRLPLVAALVPVLDRRAGLAVGGVAAYAYAIEAVGVATGWPYGEFEYLVELGPMVAGVPAGLALFFLPLALNGYLLAVMVFERRRLLVPAGALAAVLAIDLVLDPAAVGLGFWAYVGGGPYYGVPLSNYGGWLLSGAVAVVAFEAGFDRERLARRVRTCEFALDDLVSFVVLWGAVNAWYGNWIPVALVVGLVAALARAGRLALVPSAPDRRVVRP